jgi:signal peptidase II
MLGRGLLVAALVAVADQAAKIAVLRHFGDPAPPVSHAPQDPGALFNLVLTWNYGVSYGLFNTRSPVSTLIFVLIEVAIVLGLVLWLRNVRQTLLALAIGLIIGGAIGNVIDRLWHGAVVDFLDFSGLWFPWVFNPADAAISVGVALLVLDSLLARAKSPV